MGADLTGADLTLSVGALAALDACSDGIDDPDHHERSEP